MAGRSRMFRSSKNGNRQGFDAANGKEEWLRASLSVHEGVDGIDDSGVYPIMRSGPIIGSRRTERPPINIYLSLKIS